MLNPKCKSHSSIFLVLGGSLTRNYQAHGPSFIEQNAKHSSVLAFKFFYLFDNKLLLSLKVHYGLWK